MDSWAARRCTHRAPVTCQSTQFAYHVTRPTLRAIHQVNKRVLWRRLLLAFFG